MYVSAVQTCTSASSLVLCLVASFSLSDVLRESCIFFLLSVFLFLVGCLVVVVVVFSLFFFRGWGGVERVGVRACTRVLLCVCVCVCVCVLRLQDLFVLCDNIVKCVIFAVYIVLPCQKSSLWYE